MSHNYLFDTYDYIAQRLAVLKKQHLKTGEDALGRQNAAGRIEALCQFEHFLSDHFDARLPRRLARQRAGQRLCPE